MFVSISRFRQNPEEIYSVTSRQIPFPTSYTLALVAEARALLERINRPRCVYHKAGVFLADIVADAERQQSMLLQIAGDWLKRLTEAVDKINRKNDRCLVRPL